MKMSDVLSSYFLAVATCQQKTSGYLSTKDELLERQNTGQRSIGHKVSERYFNHERTRLTFERVNDIPGTRCTGFYEEKSLHGYDIFIQWLSGHLGRHDRRRNASDWPLGVVTCVGRKAKIFENPSPRSIALV